ncbi:hypothetical protein NNC19_07105 [Clostridium sp. SHJSY1]|uniref:rolling circle replication-associated protein n=1 Tax=Clostridium sp. SHJSY1 TaxID=2942483 RepID=UPI0028749041|nr:hypothetical protein [Clostridium sp. SHJSY1]MDS0525441.1 hypothetical protein [Clostridium sp. SHJSY1]
MYNLKIIQCGNRIEIYKFNNYTVSEGECCDPYGIETNEEIEKAREKQSLKERKKTLNSTRNNIIRLIKCNPDMQTFITLTFKDEVDYKKSKYYLNILFTRLRKVYAKLKYIWVLEYGDRNNRLHYHLLCNIPIEISLSTSKEKKTDEHKTLENQFRESYWKHGWVDIRQLDQEGNTNIALYVSSYIVKNLIDLDLEGYRVVGYSRKTLNKPIEETYLTKDSIEDILKSFISNYNLTYSNSYEIGHFDENNSRIGTVSYFDFMKKE